MVWICKKCGELKKIIEVKRCNERRYQCGWGFESIWKKVKGTAIKALRSDVGKFYQNYYNILKDCLLKVFQKPKTDLIAT